MSHSAGRLSAVFALVAAGLFGGAAPASAARAELIGRVPSSSSGLVPSPTERGVHYVAVPNGGSFRKGSLLRVKDGRSRRIHTFSSPTSGERPVALTIANRRIYGVVARGGDNGSGYVFRLHRNRVIPLVSFPPSASPMNLFAADGYLYGRADRVGAISAANVYRVPLQGLSAGPAEAFAVEGTRSVALLGGRLFVGAERLVSSGGSHGFRKDLYEVALDGSVALRAENFGETVAAHGNAVYGAQRGALSIVSRLDLGTAERTVFAEVPRRAWGAGAIVPQLVTTPEGRLYLCANDGVWSVSAGVVRMIAPRVNLVASIVGRRLYGFGGYRPFFAYRIEP